MACKMNEFKCGSGQCLISFRVCDIVKNCPDGDDKDIAMCKVRLYSILWHFSMIIIYLFK